MGIHWDEAAKRDAERNAVPADATLEPGESIALTVARAQVGRGEAPTLNIATVLVMALDRLTGVSDWTALATGDTGPEHVLDRCQSTPNGRCARPDPVDCFYGCSERPKPSHMFKPSADDHAVCAVCGRTVVVWCEGYASDFALATGDTETPEPADPFAALKALPEWDDLAQWLVADDGQKVKRAASALMDRVAAAGPAPEPWPTGPSGLPVKPRTAFDPAPIAASGDREATDEEPGK